jgi:hypothetical protein
MNVGTLMKWLTEVGIPDAMVSIGVEADNTWCLTCEELPATVDTPARTVWEVFWREQGNRYDWARFTNEQVACHYLFGRLTWAQVARGAVGLLVDEEPELPQDAQGSLVQESVTG